MSVLGLGTDVVHVDGFAEQLADPASAFAERTFTAAERATSAARPGPDAVHLAARFAAKEALLKAWSAARAGEPPALAPHELDLREIEVVSDPFGRPQLRLHGAVAEAVSAVVGATISPTSQHVLLSLSHDGPVAAAVVLLQRPARVAPADAAAPLPLPEEITP